MPEAKLLPWSARLPSFNVKARPLRKTVWRRNYQDRNAPPPMSTCPAKSARATLQPRSPGDSLQRQNYQRRPGHDLQTAPGISSPTSLPSPATVNISGCRHSCYNTSQSATTLSGGEAQRIPSSESSRPTGRTLYILGRANDWATHGRCR